MEAIIQATTNFFTLWVTLSITGISIGVMVAWLCFGQKKKQASQKPAPHHMDDLTYNHETNYAPIFND